MKIQATYTGMKPFDTPEKQKAIEEILAEAFAATPECREVMRQMQLVQEATLDLIRHGKTAVEMDGDKIIRVISPDSDEFPK